MTKVHEHVTWIRVRAVVLQLTRDALAAVEANASGSQKLTGELIERDATRSSSPLCQRNGRPQLRPAPPIA
jgi:hypothetical protein